VEHLLIHHGLYGYRERLANFKRFMANLYETAETNPTAGRIVAEAEAKFYALMANFEFLPNSPTLMNAGRELQQLSACYVLPVPDSIEGIFGAVKNQALIHKSGGGTGFSFGRIRPADDAVQSTKGIASGPISFMKIFDAATEQVKQGGTRRGANMAILPYWHPNVVDFITMKRRRGNTTLENFNISVGIDAAFMDAVKKGGTIDLRNPRTDEVVRTLPARELFELMIECAWECGDPGYVVLDRINHSGSNPTPQLGEIEATNPCGEQPLLPNEPCNLGSINLYKFVTGHNGSTGIDWERLRETVFECIHFLDNVIDLNDYPVPEIEEMAKGNRRIGLGVMGWAETLVALHVPYDSEQAIEKAEEVMAFINRASLEASIKLAEKRGVFPNWKDSIYDPEGKHFRGEHVRPRNCARTTIAPTGTIAIAAGLQGSGIEPFFAIAYTRYNAKGLDALKSGVEPAAEDTFFEVNPQFKTVAEASGYFGLSEKDLWKKIDANHKSVRGIPEIPADVQALFATAHDVAFDHHIAVQAAFQKYTDNAVSKTINCANETTKEEIGRAYMLAYDLGVKGLTVYRDGSKSHQVLNLTAGGAKAEPAAAPAAAKRSEAATGVTSEYYEKETGYGPLHVNIIYDEDGPYRVFANIPPLGTEIAGLTAVIGILLSKYLDSGGKAERILKHLNSVKGDKPLGFGPNRVESIPHALSQILREHLKKHGHLTVNGNQAPPASVPRAAEAGESATCPQCYSTNVEFVSGCREPTCFDCGFSNCS
jgi:ribonucleoside-diphosphate reductase alpha chain